MSYQVLPQEIENQILRQVFVYKFGDVLYELQIKSQMKTVLNDLVETYNLMVHEWKRWKKPKVYLGINYSGERLAKKLFDEYEEPYFDSGKASEQEIENNLKKWERFYNLKDKRGKRCSLTDIEYCSTMEYYHEKLNY